MSVDFLSDMTLESINCSPESKWWGRANETARDAQCTCAIDSIMAAEWMILVILK